MNEWAKERLEFLEKLEGELGRFVATNGSAAHLFESCYEYGCNCGLARAFNGIEQHKSILRKLSVSTECAAGRSVGAA